MDIGVIKALERKGKKPKLLFALDNNKVALETYRSYINSYPVDGNIEYSRLSEDEDMHNVLICDSIENVPNDFLRSIPGEILIGGPPCQDFTATRNGNDVKLDKSKMKFYEGRKNLYQHYLRFLILLQPDLFVFENVLGIRTSNTLEKSIYEQFLSYIEKIDTNSHYTFIDENDNDQIISSKYKIIHSNPVNLKYYGVPQERRRIFIIGIKEEIIESKHIDLSLFENKITNPIDAPSYFPLTPIEIFEGQPLTSLQEKYESIMDEYSHLFNNKNFPNKKMKEYYHKMWLPSRKFNFDIVKDYLRINKLPHDIALTKLTEKIEISHTELLNQLGYLNKPVMTSNLDHSEPLRSIERINARMKMIPPNGNWENVEKTKYQVKGTKSFHYRRLHPLKPSYTILSGKSGGGSEGYHYEISRQKLSHRELARLQTFPDDLIFSGNSKSIRTQIGEAVPPFGLENLLQQVFDIIYK